MYLYLSQQTISEKGILDLLSTFKSSIFFYILIVTTLIINSNSQVTKPLSTEVGTSEAIRLLNKKNIQNINEYKDLSQKNKQWIAGLIDGTGFFYLSKKGYAKLDITMDTKDERALQTVKNVYGGSIKLKSGGGKLRYRLHNKEGLLNLVEDVNGRIRTSNRILQLNRICVKYGIALIYPYKLSLDNGWLSGFLDARAIIAIKDQKMMISVHHETYDLFKQLYDIHKGKIAIDTGGNGSFVWYLEEKVDILNIIEYFKKYPLKSTKNKDLHLIPKFYQLIKCKANVADVNSRLANLWKSFLGKWYSTL